MDLRPVDIVINLLHRYECVVLPGLGGFVSQPVNAQYDNVQCIIQPPRIQLSFNHHLTRNDGLLLQEWSMCKNLSLMLASDEIKLWVHQLKDCLESNGHADFGGLGSFVRSENGKINFVFVQNTLFSGYGFGLRPLKLKKQNDFIETPIISIDADNPSIQVSTKSSQWKKWAAAAAILLPLSFYSWWIPTHTRVMESGHLTVQDLNPFARNTTFTALYQKRSTHFNIAEDKIAEDKIEAGIKHVTFDSDVTVEVMVESSQEESITQPQMAVGGYYLVTGCFRDKSNANRFLQEMQNKGLKAMMIDEHGGLHRIGLGGFEKANEAQAEMAALKSAGYNSWVLHK